MNVDISKVSICPIGIMEDESETIYFIKETLLKLGCTETIPLNNKQEVLDSVTEGKIQNYIIDINMGKNRTQEGLDTLEEIKIINESIFVAILSGFNGDHKRRAIKLQADFFQSKSDNRVRDIRNIIYEMLQHVDKKIQVFKNDLRNDEVKNDINKNAFDSLLLDERWFSENINKYVALCEGSLIGVNSNRSSLLSEIEKIGSRKPKFISKVTRETDIIDLSSPFDILG